MGKAVDSCLYSVCCCCCYKSVAVPSITSVVVAVITSVAVAFITSVAAASTESVDTLPPSPGAHGVEAGLHGKVQTQRQTHSERIYCECVHMCTCVCVHLCVYARKKWTMIL